MEENLSYDVLVITETVNNIKDPRQRPGILDGALDLLWHTHKIVVPPDVTSDDDSIQAEPPPDKYSYTINTIAVEVMNYPQTEKFRAFKESAEFLAKEADESTDPNIAPTEQDKAAGKGSWLGDKYREFLNKLHLDSFPKDAVESEKARADRYFDESNDDTAIFEGDDLPQRQSDEDVPDSDWDK